MCLTPALSGTRGWPVWRPLDWKQCCHLPRQGRIAPGTSVEMMAGHLVMRPGRGGRAPLLDLASGTPFGPISTNDAKATAMRFAKGNGLAPGAVALEIIQSDQWTVADGYARDRPLYQFALGDAAGTHVYVSSTSGAVVLSTDRTQRFWNYLGAVPHWLYFAGLRARPELWTNIVIYASLFGSFLVAAGLFIGIRQWLRARRAKRWSPYRGFMWWHHVPGLVFGTLLLTWTISGLLTMNPWGLLEGPGSRIETRALQGAPIGAAQMDKVLAALAARPPDSVASLQLSPFDGRPYLIAAKVNGARVRLGPDGTPQPLAADLGAIGRKLGARGAPTLLPSGDDYYLPREEGRPRLLPVLRFQSAGSDVLYYVDPLSGALAARVDDTARADRWLEGGFHRMDFFAGLRQRPLWDIVTLFLLLGVTFVAGTGVYAAIRYLAGWARLLAVDRAPRDGGSL